jgi:hypothetical protein
LVWANILFSNIGAFNLSFIKASPFSPKKVSGC